MKMHSRNIPNRSILSHNVSKDHSLPQNPIAEESLPISVIRFTFSEGRKKLFVECGSTSRVLRNDFRKNTSAGYHFDSLTNTSVLYGTRKQCYEGVRPTGDARKPTSHPTTGNFVCSLIDSRKQRPLFPPPPSLSFTQSNPKLDQC